MGVLLHICQSAKLNSLPIFHTIRYSTHKERVDIRLSGWDEGGYCSSTGDLSTSSGSPPDLTWTPIPQPPVYASTIATLSGVPVLVGGAVRGIGTYSSTVYSLSHGQWVECGHLCEARSVCLVASLTTSHNYVSDGREGFHRP